VCPDNICWSALFFTCAIDCKGIVKPGVSLVCTCQERDEAARLFEGGANVPHAEPAEVEQAEVSALTEATDAAVAKLVKGPTPAQLMAIKAMIASATTLEEVQRIENAVKSGNLPSEISAMDEG
jgi:hypothetical protein